ncbi:Histidine utilization repressor [Caenispirillum salinarum AK4]|uniref:Histidine utilization repressor n=1 Tax=Caenispirillum salinarum AK4 TaxID=1238182 RepID=K9H3F5_9PROT|nr:histidine utilization repressor [Caenispirillum salinarum]EKV32800.1 Histidine utilization repressor [Caenispirillum salinarum AK4]
MKVSASQPRYRQIKETLRNRILSGEWPEGFQLPSENQLLKEFSVSRMTVHRALRELTDEGVLTRVQGVGTFVAERAASAEILELRPVSDEIAARGNRHSCRVDLLEEATADARLARSFNLPAGARLFHSVVVHYENEVPLQYEDRWVNPNIAPRYLEQDFRSKTPTEYLTDLERTPEVEHMIEAALPGATAARLLNIPESEPCLRLTRRTWVRGHVVTLALLVHPGTRYRLGTRFTARPGQVPLDIAL